MTYEEAAAILGPELTARLDAQAADDPPLTPAQIALLAPLMARDPVLADKAA